MPALSRKASNSTLSRPIDREMGVVSVTCSVGVLLPLRPVGKVADTGETTLLLDVPVEAGSVRDKTPSKNCPKRCVSIWGAVLPLLLSFLLVLRASVVRVLGDGRAAAACLTESMCESIAIWNRGHRSMLVPLIYPSTTGHFRR